VAGGDKVRVHLQHQWFPRVLRETVIAPRRWLHPDVILAVYEIQQHLFMVPAQTNHTLGILEAEFAHICDTPGNVGTSVNQIAKKDQRIGRWVTRQHIEQPAQLRTAAVNVSNNKSLHQDYCLVSSVGT
jgi:hypothetical protein